MDSKQTSRFSKGEMEVLKNTFKNDELLYAVRNVLFQFPNKDFSLSPEALAVVKKIVLPELTEDVPVGMQSDLFAPLMNIKDALPEMAYQQIKSNDLVIQYLNERYRALCGENVMGGIVLKQLADPIPGESDEQRLIRTTAYLHILKYVENCMNQIHAFANATELTEEEKKKQAVMNSSK